MMRTPRRRAAGSGRVRDAGAGWQHEARLAAGAAGGAVGAVGDPQVRTFCADGRGSGVLPAPGEAEAGRGGRCPGPRRRAVAGAAQLRQGASSSLRRHGTGRGPAGTTAFWETPRWVKELAAQLRWASGTSWRGASTSGPVRTCGAMDCRSESQGNWRETCNASQLISITNTRSQMLRTDLCTSSLPHRLTRPICVLKANSETYTSPISTGGWWVDQSHGKGGTTFRGGRDDGERCVVQER